ncbi:Diphthamide biosynthesis protein 2 [Tolypocladium ophioglossoides CBS 100239]|uniref:2-(3-amino-3-carboxypropyl)histidine synthase subunit 2 n=1 Tax=Tolypocladium ophioglossoides (strain CBS 100239) TaxID=1163406 RepID=A0A0L0NJC0_TOLOC|nr:Diphthamide biosynthesis protein 2 [Tolypocladium ophioglossoides CBS 100239]
MSDLAAPPVLSTPDDHILEVPAAAMPTSTLSDDALKTTYEIARTAAEIRGCGWKTIALQFPDHMLVDAPRVVESLRRELPAGDVATRIHILADTSYSACCVDEVAAEHADADVVVHYGRTCLSPTSRLPVIYVYTSHELHHPAVIREFTSEFGDKESRVVVMADLTYQDHVDGLVKELNTLGYENVVATEVVRDPAGVIPNRRISGPEREQELLKTYSLFHISDPPASLLLALQSRFASLRILSTPSPASPSLDNPTLRTAGLLRRRFARVLSLASAGVVGILVNTLSVSNYLSSIDLLRERIARAGKKSYTVVVGKLNPAKLANFSEVEGWVVVGCWESGLVEEDAGYWRPVVTPFEMEVALMGEEERTWGGEWWGGIEKMKTRDTPLGEAGAEKEQDGHGDAPEDEDAEDGVQGEESLPPQFDLRTGKLVSHSRPMQLTIQGARSNAIVVGGGGGDTKSLEGRSGALAKRVVGELASVNGVASPGAEYLRSKRTWQGLGSDFDAEASTVVEEGRSGLARGYRVGDGDGDGDDARH